MVTRLGLFGKGVIVKTPGVRHSAGHLEFPYPRCPHPITTGARALFCPDVYRERMMLPGVWVEDVDEFETLEEVWLEDI